jgi:hypothetical protein
MNERPRFEQPGESHPEHVEFSAANLVWEWHDDLGRLGITVACVVVDFTAAREALEKVGPGFEEGIGRDLVTADLGHFDSLHQGAQPQLFFYLVTKKLPQALQFLREALEIRGLVRFCKIAIADDEAKLWREWTGPSEGKS